MNKRLQLTLVGLTGCGIGMMIGSLTSTIIPNDATYTAGGATPDAISEKRIDNHHTLETRKYISPDKHTAWELRIIQADGQISNIYVEYLK